MPQFICHKTAMNTCKRKIAFLISSWSWKRIDVIDRVTCSDHYSALWWQRSSTARGMKSLNDMALLSRPAIDNIWSVMIIWRITEYDVLCEVRTYLSYVEEYMRGAGAPLFPLVPSFPRLLLFLLFPFLVGFNHFLLLYPSLSFLPE